MDSINFGGRYIFIIFLILFLGVLVLSMRVLEFPGGDIPGDTQDLVGTEVVPANRIESVEVVEEGMVTPTRNYFL